MTVAALCFYLFASVAVVSGVMVVTARNPVHAVLFLILAFFNSAGLFVLIGAEYLAMALVVVYVGAVAVLFLFVVMMLDVNFQELRAGAARYISIGAVVGLALLAELSLVLGGAAFGDAKVMGGALPTPPADQVENVRALGQILYTDLFVLFQISGLILLVAMIGAIVLTLRSRPGVRRQRISDQLERTPEKAVEVVKVPIGGGAQ
ncbi:MAG: NADH-quinone oxidoreductase subunit J [Alphaproteobacteria bacterium]|jgi:NADH-quinone oxidoreductase subunit J